MQRATAMLVILSLAGCGGSGAGDDGDDGPDAAAGGFVTLVAGEWELPVGREGYYCVRATVDEEMYVRAFRPIAPSGTHHTALSIDRQGGDDGAYPCTASDVGFRLLFGSGVGTQPYALPDGVAFRLAAGEQILLNLHLYNTTDGPLSGRSGIEVERVPVEQVVHEAETIYAIDPALEVPSGASTARQRCRIDADSTVVGLFPHMHRLGTHMRAASVRGGGTPEVFFDEPYAFEAQLNHAIAPLELVTGDVIEYDCSFSNPGAPVAFGDSSDDEMCVLGMYRYPAQRTASLCPHF